MGIYVEIDIDAPIDAVWTHTQTPGLHERWDLRFTSIDYLPRPDASEPQRFLYTTRIGLGLAIAGDGSTSATRDLADGSRTSALSFRSDDATSLIRVGSGYWKYIRVPGGVRFLTWYDYTTRFGALGRLADRLMFRPLLGWATAWSFDRLRLWLERGIDPAIAMRLSVTHAVCRVTIALVWVYHGLVPKLLYEHPAELSMLVAAGVPTEISRTALEVIGWAEFAFGVALLIAWRARWLFGATIVALLAALVTVGAGSPHTLVAPFNPVTLNAAVVALAVAGLVAGRDIPTATTCRRKRPEQSA